MSGPVDILSMLNKAQAKCDQQNSVAAFFNGFADKNVNSQTTTTAAKNNIDSLEQIERQLRPATQPAKAPEDNPLAQLFFKNNGVPAAVAPKKSSSSSSQPKTVAAKEKPKPSTNGNSAVATAPPPGFALEKKLITPTMLLNSSASKEPARKPVKAPPPTAQQPKPLTKSQLIEAVQFLMETDEEFVSKVHDAYLKTVSSNGKN